MKASQVIAGSAVLLSVVPRYGSLLVAAGDVQVAALKPSLVSTGLKNLGNTCYMNAQLQCAFHIPAVRSAALMDDNDEEMIPNDALLGFRELLKGMITAADENLPPFIPGSFCMKLGIPVMVQQDSQEFWKLLLPAVERESLSDLYKGSFEDYITALDGSGREKRREELFLDLSLDITSSSTLMDSLQKSFGEPELLSEAEGNGWRPEKGADKVDAHKGSSLIAEGLPSILQCHLKRFNYDWQTDTMTKLNNRFSFPEVLDLSGLCKSVDGKDDQNVIYDLQSIVIHVGEYGVGHYYSYVRPDIQSDTWYRFNDDVVEEVTFQEVIDDAFGGKVSEAKPKNKTPQKGFFRRIRMMLGHGGGGGSPYGWGGSTSNAYVVQYVRRSHLHKLYPEGECD